MSSTPNPDPEKIFNEIVRGSPIVAATTTSLSTFYKDVVTALAKSAENSIKNPPENKEIEAAVDRMTISMIDELNTRVASILKTTE